MSAMFQNWVLSSVWIPHLSKQLPLRRVMRKSVLCTPGQLHPTCFGSGDLRKPESDVGFLALPQEIRSPCQQDIIQMHQLSALLCHNKSCASRTTASKSLGWYLIAFEHSFLSANGNMSSVAALTKALQALSCF